jgi:hypothetical protein
MDKQTSITYVDDNKLIEAIHDAQHRFVFMAPGVSQDIALALTDAWSRLSVDNVTVILDVDPEVCRLGYGTLEGLKTLREAAARAIDVLGQYVSKQDVL